MNLPIIEEEIVRIKRVLLQSKNREELMVAQTVLRGAIIDAGRQWLRAADFEHLREYTAMISLTREL